MSKIEKIGWKPKKTTAQSLVDSYRWYRKHWREYTHKTGVTHRVIWKEGVFGLVKHFF